MPKPRVETLDWWDECVALKDQLSLRELGDRFGVTASAISNAFRRVGVVRKPAKSGPRSPKKSGSQRIVRSAEEPSDLPPEPGESLSGDVRKRPAGITIKGLPGRRSPLNGHEHLLGTVPDSELATRFGMAVGSVANYRRRKKIPAFRRSSSPGSPRAAHVPRKSKMDAFRNLVGTMPDAAVATRAGVSSATVSAYRRNHNLPRFQRARGPALVAEGSSSASPGTRFAWRVTLASGDAGIVVGETVVDAAMSLGAQMKGQVLNIERLDALL